ncbi:MAG: ABC transporter substrate-binding protein [Treponema sp.]|nr:ABC transporter substrate-binding protein [Treponema sp.]
MRTLFFRALFVASVCIFVSSSLFAVAFTDALNRTVSVESPQKVAVLQGSLASVWTLAGGKIACATADAFIEPPALEAQQAAELNKKWHTDVFSAHDAGVVKKSGGVENVGTMMNPSSELLLANGADFVIMSANISGHKKLLPLFESAGIACAFFELETFSDYLNMLKICTDITGKTDLYRRNGAEVQKKCEKIIKTAQKKAKKTPHQILLLRAFSAGASAKNSTNNMTGAILKDLGAHNIADSDRSLNEDLSLEKIIADDPEFIFVTTMGASEEKAIAGFEKKLASSPAWNDLRAVKNEKCYILPRELFHFKPTGERWVDCYEILSGLLY